MLDLIWLLPTFPLLGFLILVLSSGNLPKKIVAVVGVGSIGLSFLTAAIIAVQFLASGEEYFIKEVWVWMSVGEFTPGFSFYLDGLSLVMMLIITGVGFLIHLYSAGFMADDPSYSRFFAYMNLFVASMLMLVLADNLVLLYLGWEGVGLCSYLLIGFWYENPANGYAARKAFITTRVGDTSMAIGLFLLFAQLGTLNIQDMLHAAEMQWPMGSGLAVATSLLLLGGAVGKSAQLPLQTWLPDAMAGPTPISALIHAATMVTAGVYLIARTHILFELAPNVQLLVAWIGLITLLMAGFTAMTQHDIKRILAYSTISQIGYMFLGLGVGAWSASVFHLMTHAFFKALLFLAAGTVILSLHHEHDIFKMGGKRKQLPIAFASFMIGSLALAAFPFTSGYFSKDEILIAALEMDGPGIWLWAGGVIGAFFTGIYSFRLVFVVFFGESKGHHEAKEVAGFSMATPLFILMVLALFGGWIQIPLDAVFGHGEVDGEHHISLLMHGIMIGMPLLGIGVSYLFFMSKTFSADKLVASGLGAALHKFWFSGWGMDALYKAVLIKPFLFLARINKNDIIDSVYAMVVELTRTAHAMIAKTQTGQIRWYAVTVAAGLVLIISLGVLL
ncbi:MAG: NADH-quinone oxidoreductase subunit L [SAR86 cluster bacterium]|uniref:NADH-quinone oxidoreductase subunit L n=1 Tax=SAR86 cluster bacterium TaxID=2030880 RepID=A0A2A5BB01_9GAMM|nr:MAG: NADH-quinone oxidoreductase subunit L [SAR86 cluster bacterium]